MFRRLRRRFRINSTAFLLSSLVCIIIIMPLLILFVTFILPPTPPDFISSGEKVLLSDFPGESENKQEATELLAQKKYEKAIDLLVEARESHVNDPEAFIYLNNAEIELESIPSQSYTIAVAVPLNKSKKKTAKNSGIEILRGIAQAQELVNHPESYPEFNITQSDGEQLGQKINGFSLKILIADDGDDLEKAKEIGRFLEKETDIKAVVGHLSSTVTKAVAPFYEENKFILISPTSTATSLIPARQYIFRTVPTNEDIAKTLADYLKDNNREKAVVIYNPDSDYSKDLWEKFRKELPGVEGEDLKFSNISLNEIKEQVDGGTKALVLLPNTSTRNEAINLIDQVRDEYSDLKIVGGDSLYNPELTNSENALEVVIAAPWHHKCSSDPDFLEIAKKLWGTSAVSWRTAYAYDATLVLIEALKALKQPSSSRQDLWKVLVSENPRFKVKYGATGEISFKDNGDRQEGIIQLVKVVANENDGKPFFAPELGCSQ